MADNISIFYDKDQTRQILRAFKAMDDEAVTQSKKMGFELAQYALKQIQGKASTLQERRISLTGRASKSSKIGEFSFGYQKTAFSGGANTSRNTENAPPYGKGILAGVEFGSSREKSLDREPLDIEVAAIVATGLIQLYDLYNLNLLTNGNEHFQRY